MGQVKASRWYEGVGQRVLRWARCGCRSSREDASRLCVRRWLLGAPAILLWG